MLACIEKKYLKTEYPIEMKDIRDCDVANLLIAYGLQIS